MGGEGLLKRGHSLLHCWGMDHAWVWAGASAIALVMVLYAAVAVRAWALSHWCQTDRGRRAYRAQIALFLLCTLSGYGFELFALADQNIYRLRVLSTFLTAAAAAAYLAYVWNAGADLFDPRERLREGIEGRE